MNPSLRRADERRYSALVAEIRVCAMQSQVEQKQIMVISMYIGRISLSFFKDMAHRSTLSYATTISGPAGYAIGALPASPVMK